MRFICLPLGIQILHYENALKKQALLIEIVFKLSLIEVLKYFLWGSQTFKPRYSVSNEENVGTIFLTKNFVTPFCIHF